MAKDLVEVTHNELKQHLKVCYEAKLPLFVWGTTGIGKSETVRDVSDELGIEVIDMRISQMDPSDVRGLPKYDDKSETTKWLPPNWLPRDGKGILFLDELNLAPPSIQASCYQLILDRRIGDYVLPEGWAVVGAGNTIDDRANVFTMASPLKNRLTQVKLKMPTKDEWTEWAVVKGISKDIIGFVQWKPEYLHTFEKNKDANVFATHRSWVFADTLLKSNKNKVDERQLVGSCVGDGVAMEFTAFKKLNAKINLSKILEKPELVKELDISEKYCLVTGLSGKYESNRKELSKILKVSLELEAEFGILLARLMKVGGKFFKADLTALTRKHDKSAEEFVSRYFKFLADKEIQEAR